MAGVSPTTITHVLQGNPKTRVSPETRERILKTVRETGYTPHALASALDRRRVRHLAVVAANTRRVWSSFLDALFDVCRDAAQARGYFLMSYDVTDKGSPDTSQRMLDLIRSGRVDGLLINKSDILTRDIRVLKAEACPLVVIESTFDVDTLDVPAVATDHRLGGQLAVEHLAALGHQRLAVVTRPRSGQPDAWVRYQDVVFLEAVRAAAAARNLAEPVIVDGDCFDRARTLQALESLMQRRPRPTAILFADDIMALTALGYLSGRGLRVPDEVSLVGYGDAPFSAQVAPSLTTIKVPVVELGRVAVHTLIELLEGRTLAAPRRLLAPTLVARESSGPCRENAP